MHLILSEYPTHAQLIDILLEVQEFFLYIRIADAKSGHMF